MAEVLVTLKDVVLGFGGPPLFADASLEVRRGDRLCLVGRNGSGKSTLLGVLAGAIEPDRGSRRAAPALRIARLGQDVDFGDAATVGDYVGGDAVPEHRVAAILDRIALDGASPPDTLSGGEARRAALARALVAEPELLLLDEPTNHLDIATIAWLEGWLENYRGGLVVISHDRALLRRLARRTAWLDDGVLRVRDIGFDGFEAWSEQVYGEQETTARRRETKLAAEMHWLHKGVTARRKRNQGRLRALHKLRDERRQARRHEPGLGLAAGPALASGTVAIEAENIAKSYGDRTVIADFSVRVRRGDRLAMAGPNGAGKTTLLRLLLGELAPDSGRVSHGSRLQVVSFDQRRAMLDPTRTLWQTLCPIGGDTLDVRGQPRHVAAYARDFLFDESRLKSPVANFSGGEQSRLVLAMLFAKPSNLIALDEPTNDLDMETLDLLQEVLSDYDGTVLMISHDRDFIDRLATSTILIDGRGRAEEFVGGFSDCPPDWFERHAPRPAPPKKPPPKRAPRQATALGYTEQREFDRLPGDIDRLGDELATIEWRLAKPAATENLADLGLRHRDLKAALAAAEERWLALAEKAEALKAPRS